MSPADVIRRFDEAWAALRADPGMFGLVGLNCAVHAGWTGHLEFEPLAAASGDPQRFAVPIDPAAPSLLPPAR